MLIRLVKKKNLNLFLEFLIQVSKVLTRVVSKTGLRCYVVNEKDEKRLCLLSTVLRYNALNLINFNKHRHKTMNENDSKPHEKLYNNNILSSQLYTKNVYKRNLFCSACL